MRERLIFLAEPDYVPTQWYQDALVGVMNQAKRYGYDLSVMTGLPPEPRRALADAHVLVLGMSSPWVRRTLPLLQGLWPVVINRIPRGLEGDVHTVTIDRAHGVLQLVKNFAASGRRRVALFGTDPQSISDQERVEAFREAAFQCGLDGGDAHIFPNRTLLETAAEPLCNRAGEYDAAVCANDFSAMVLLRMLRERGVDVPGDMAVAGFGDMALCRYATPSLTSVTLDFREAGSQAVNVARFLQRSGEGVRLHVSLQAKIVYRASAPGAAQPETAPGLPAAMAQRERAFYTDPSVRDLQALNEMLASMDEIDRAIVAGLMAGRTYQAVSDTEHISFSALKKRVKRLQTLCGARGRPDMERRLNEYALRFTP